MWRQVATLVTAAGTVAFVVATPIRTNAAGTMASCFADLERGASHDIVCDFPLQPSAAERVELEKQTSGFLKDVRCTVSIRIERALITEAIQTPDYVFQAPPQPVACNVTMPGRESREGAPPAANQVLPITGTFAP